MAAAKDAATLSERLRDMDERQRDLESDLGLLRQTVHELLLENRRLALGVSPKALAQSRTLSSSLGPHELPPKAQPTCVSPSNVSLEAKTDVVVEQSFALPRNLDAYLEQLRLGHFCDRIRNLGADTVEDLVDVEADDLNALGMTKLEQNRFFRAVRAQGVLSERAAIRHGDALEMLLRVDASAGALEEAFRATGWDMQDEWVRGTRAMLKEWSDSGGRLEQSRNQELLAVALTGAEQTHDAERLLHCMRTALPSLTVQLTGCCAIQRLGAISARVAIELSSAGACKMVLRALRYHDNDVELSVAGCLALSSLARNGGPEVGCTVGDVGGITRALECMAQHSENSTVFIAVCNLLQAVPISEFWSRTAQAEAATQAQHNLLRKPAAHQRDARPYCSKLGHPQKQKQCDDSDKNDNLHLPSTLSVVVAGITKYWEYPSAQAAACALIEHLVEYSEESRPVVAGTGCVKIVIRALRGKRTATAAAAGKSTLDDLSSRSVEETKSVQSQQWQARQEQKEEEQKQESVSVKSLRVVQAAQNRDVAARLQAHGCGLLSSLATGNAELTCDIKKAGGESVARSAIANHGDDERVVIAARHLLGLLDVQRIISAAKKRGDVQGVLLGMRAGIGSNAAQQLGCEAIAMLAYQTDSLFSRPAEMHRMPHGAKYGASKHPGYEKTPNQPRLAGCVETVFEAMITHQRIGPVQGAGCWALAALATAIPVRELLHYCQNLQQFRSCVAFALALKMEGRPDAAGRGGPATLLSVGDRWSAQLSAMEERAKAALHYCSTIPLVQANATALLNLLKGEPTNSVLMTHPSEGWSFVPADPPSSAAKSSPATVGALLRRSSKRR